jgi:hypothetical protein
MNDRGRKGTDSVVALMRHTRALDLTRNVTFEFSWPQRIQRAPKPSYRIPYDNFFDISVSMQQLARSVTITIQALECILHRL